MRKGNINRGVVKRTYNQEKKHYTQFTNEESLYLQEKIRSLDTSKLKVSNHLSLKSTVSYDIGDIIATMRSDDLTDIIIEFNSTKKFDHTDKRVLLRSKKVYDVEVDGNIKKCNLCFVISLLKNELITVYYNEYKDNHDTINWYRYNENLKIIA